MRIIVDLDGVLAESLTPWLAAWNHCYGRQTGVHLSRDSITEYEFDRFVPADCRSRFFELLDSYRVFESALPELGAIDALKRLIDAGHDVVIATTVLGSCPTGETQKRRWLTRWAPFFKHENLIFTQRKNLITADVMIEDCEANIDKWKADGEVKSRWGYLVQQPYNETHDGTFAEIVDCILRSFK